MDFSEIIKPGLKAQESLEVTRHNIASALGCGGLDVFSTPSMITLMECTAVYAVDPLLPQGWSTVGTELNVKHLSASPVGMKISATAELLSINGRALTFKVDAFDEKGKIGEGTHGRFIVENEKFLKKAEGKKS